VGACQLGGGGAHRRTPPSRIGSVASTTTSRQAMAAQKHQLKCPSEYSTPESSVPPCSRAAAVMPPPPPPPPPHRRFATTSAGVVMRGNSQSQRGALALAIFTYSRRGRCAPQLHRREPTGDNDVCVWKGGGERMHQSARSVGHVVKADVFGHAVVRGVPAHRPHRHLAIGCPG
jgi:hypothetical protein